MFLPHPRVKVSIVGSLCDREVACSASDRQGSNFESCVWRTVSSHSSHLPQEVLLTQFSLYVHKGGLKPDSFHFIFTCKGLAPIQASRIEQYFQQHISQHNINSTPCVCWVPNTHIRAHAVLIDDFFLLYINPLTAGAAYFRVFIFLLAQQVAHFQYVKEQM